MEKESTSFWTDIKKFEEILAKDPHSYCFAPLSELYRKLGLLDDALSVAKRGADIHPEYIGGQIALGRAYFDKGMNPEAKQSLEKVAKATPENLLAQKLLYRIYKDEGNVPSAEKALQLLVAFNPEDLESREALEAIRRNPIEIGADESVTEGSEIADPSFSAPNTPPVMETVQSCDVCEVEEADVEDPAEVELPMEADFSIDEWMEGSECDMPGNQDEAAPMPTATLAELYVSQGYYSKALEVFEQLAHQEPGNHDFNARISAVKELMQKSGEVCQQELVSMEEARNLRMETGTAAEGICHNETALIEELEQWLHSIRRRKECL